MATPQARTTKPDVQTHRRAVRFHSEADLLQALRVLTDLSDETPVDYDVIAGSHVIAMPARVHRALIPRLNQASVHFENVSVVPLSQLPLEEQA